MGSITTPEPPTPPTVGSSIQDYVGAYPDLVKLQEEWGGRDLASQRAAQAFAYPELEGLQSDVMGQISRGINEPVPDWYSSQVEDILKSQLGRNLVYNPQAQESYGLRTMEAHKGYQDYYRNLAMSMANRQPVYQTNAPTSTFTPGQAMSMNQGVFGTQGGIFGTQSDTAARQYESQMNMMGQIGGGFLGGVGGALVNSSRRYKKDIRPWNQQ